MQIQFFFVFCTWGILVIRDESLRFVLCLCLPVGCVEMELKYIVLFLMGLCIVVIVVEEIFQSQSYSRWNSPKSRLVAAKQDYNIDVVENDEEMQSFGKMADKRKKGGWVEEDDVDHRPKDVVDTDDSVWSMKRWKDWTKRVSSNSNDNKKARDNNKKDKKTSKNGRRNTERVWKDDSDDIDEDERLRKSPFIYHEEEERRKLNTPIVEKEVKYITHFLPYERRENSKHTFRTCRYKKCAFVDDMTQADLVAFKAGNIRDYNILTFQRPPDQRWLVYTIDPAIRGYRLGEDNIKSLFNATMTYNLDADIPQIFGRLRQIPPRTDVDYEGIYEGKTKSTTWFVSHCVTPSRREDYVKRMQTVIDIDIYGECGNFSCGGGLHSRSHDAKVCLPLVTKHYKFYLAFENALCQDYVTEKFFKLFQDVQIIPVVRGGFQYKKYFPSGVFINADDFESPEALSQYLIELGNDKQRYVQMLKQKDQWRVVLPDFRQCLLCEYLHTNPPEKFYPNVQKKFGRHSCWFPQSL